MAPSVPLKRERVTLNGLPESILHWLTQISDLPTWQVPLWSSVRSLFWAPGGSTFSPFSYPLRQDFSVFTCVPFKFVITGTNRMFLIR